MATNEKVYVLFVRTNYCNPFPDLETSFEGVYDEKAMLAFKEKHKVVDRNSFEQGYFFDTTVIHRG